MVARMLRSIIGWPAKSHYPMLVAAFLLGNLIAVLFSVVQPSATFRLLQHYTYQETMASNGVRLYSIQTDPQNIVLKPITSNVSLTTDYGINGGFFWNGDLLSIAVMNDQPLKGEQDDYGSGWYNIDYPKGTLVWDEITRQFSVQVVQDAHQIKVTDKRHYWAQGGVSMSLGHDASWVNQAMAEDMPALDEARLRSGVVYDDRQNLWLVVTDKTCTVEQFRAAIVEKIGKGRLVDGIFLDGDGSSQMNTAQKILKGDSREVYQMLALKRK